MDIDDDEIDLVALGLAKVTVTEVCEQYGPTEFGMMMNQAYPNQKDFWQAVRCLAAQHRYGGN